MLVLALAAALTGGAGIAGPVLAAEPGGSPDERAPMAAANESMQASSDCQPGVAVTGDQYLAGLAADDRDDDADRNGTPLLDDSVDVARADQYVVLYSETIEIEQ
jgi:hypothetical protein